MDSLPSSEELLNYCLEHMTSVGWGDFSVENIVQQKALPPGVFLRFFPSKEAVLEAFFTRIDASVLHNLELEQDATEKDVLLEGLMVRFETLQPYRILVERLYNESFKAPCLGFFLLNQLPQSLKKTLPPLGQEASFLRTYAIFLIYSQSFRVWLDDASPDFSKTLSHIDRLLERYFALI